MNPLNSPWLAVLAPLVLLPSLGQCRDFGASIAFASESTDNANKTHDDGIAERQDRLELGLSALHKAEYWQLDARYIAEYNTFSENTQEDRSTLQGDGKLILGGMTQPANFSLIHSRRNLLGAPQQVNLLQNTDERTITTASPLVRARLSPVDFLLLSADYSDVSFKLNPVRDSKRTTGRIQWQHALSKLDSLELLTQHTAIKFNETPLADYTLDHASLSYSAQLKRLNYTIGGGYSHSDSDSLGNTNNPYLNLNADYKTGDQTLAFNFSKEISDTSLGKGNRGEVSEPLALDAIGVGFDQIKLQTAELSWATAWADRRLGVNAALQWDEEDYVTLPEDNTQTGARLGVNYILSRRSSVAIDVQQQKTTSDSSSTQGSFNSRIWNLAYRHSFAHGIDGSIFGRLEKRTSEQTLFAYDENVLGASLAYQY